MMTAEAISLSAQIVIAGFTFFGLVFTAFFSYLAARNSKQVNTAVNNAAVPTAKRIYQLASENHETILKIAAKLESHVAQEDEQVRGVEAKLEEIAKGLSQKET